MDDPEEYVTEVTTQAPVEFDRAFDRWRELYHSARTQLIEANKQSQVPGLSGADRRKIKAAQMQATDQIGILEQGKATNSSDFYSYRYLATEGFLPATTSLDCRSTPSFPERESPVPSCSGPAFLPSPSSDLAVSSITRAAHFVSSRRSCLPRRAPTTVGSSQLRTSPSARTAAFPRWRGRALHACAVPMAGALSIKRALRIDNVEAAPTERITANDEERIRQGFEIQTVFSWPRKQGRIEILEAEFRTGGASLFTLQYANSAEISRINKGLKRRARRDRTWLHDRSPNRVLGQDRR